MPIFRSLSLPRWPAAAPVPGTPSPFDGTLRRAAARGLAVGLLVALSPLGCSTKPDLVKAEHEFICEQIKATVGLNDGYDVPGVAGAPRWGIPESAPATRRVRRSFSKLDGAEKKRVIDAFIALKKITTGSGDPGSPRADYNSFCEELGLETYERNLYDFYVEAHSNAFVSMKTPHEEHVRMAHMSPQFLAWHRYLLLRVEADIGQAIGDPDFALPYWDWTDCYEDGDPNNCDLIFERPYLGSPGTCDEGDQSVEGYLTDQGFAVNLYTNDESAFSPESIVCGQRSVERAVACSEYVVGPPDSRVIAGIFDREVYDEAPYNSCNSDQDVSFRQYLEGFTDDETRSYCVATGCHMHGRGHAYVGGDMDGSSASPNDPIFFLHHAQVDRLWAAWQEANLTAGADRSANYGNPGFPDPFLGPLFNFTAVKASEMFDYKALGYEYDTLPRP